MNVLDWMVLLGTILSIAAYGAWHTRGTRAIDTYFKGSNRNGWGTIGRSASKTTAWNLRTKSLRSTLTALK